jgi:limonene-1,2-epoxide hydrolase
MGIGRSSEIMEAFLEAYWKQDIEAVIALAHPDFLWLNMAMPKSKIEGSEGLRRLMEAGHGGFPEPIEVGEHVTGEVLEDGGRIQAERVDRFKVRGCWIEIPCNALWEVRDGKVKLWKDYYDVGAYIRGMAQAGIQIDTSGWW